MSGCVDEKRDLVQELGERPPGAIRPLSEAIAFGCGEHDFAREGSTARIPERFERPHLARDLRLGN